MDIVSGLDPEFSALMDKINVTQGKVDDMVNVAETKAADVQKTSTERMQEAGLSDVCICNGVTHQTFSFLVPSGIDASDSQSSLIS